MNPLGFQSHQTTCFAQATRSKWSDIPRYCMDQTQTGILRELRDLATFKAAVEETVARVFGDQFDMELTFELNADEKQAKKYDLNRLKETYEKHHNLAGNLSQEELDSLLKKIQKDVLEINSEEEKEEGKTSNKKRKRNEKKKKKEKKSKLKTHYINTIIKRHWIPWLRELFVYIKMWGFCPYRLKAIDYRGELHYYPVIPPMESGFVEVYQVDRELRLVWNWIDTDTIHKKKRIDDCIDESVRFIVKNMPSIYGRYNSDLMSLAKDYLHLDITEDLQTQSNVQKSYPTHVVEYHENGKSTNMGDAESQWSLPFSRNGVNLEYEKYKKDLVYEKTGFHSNQFFFAHDTKNVKNASQLTGLGNDGVVGYVPMDRLRSLERIHKNTQRKLDVTSMTSGPSPSNHPSVEYAFNTKRLEENEKFVNVAFPQVGDPDYQKKKDRFDRLTAIVADNSLFMNLLTDRQSGGGGGGGGGGSGIISKTPKNMEETKLHFASRYKSIVEFYSEKLKEVWMDAYSRMFEIELKIGKNIFKEGYRRKWGKKASEEEVEIFISLLNLNVTFPKAAFLSVSELKEMWDYGLISEKDFYKHTVTVTGIEDRGKDGVERMKKRLKQLRDFEIEANKPKPTASTSKPKQQQKPKEGAGEKKKE